MGKTNYWRIGTIVLSAVAVAMACFIALLLMTPETPRFVETYYAPEEKDGTADDYQVSLTPAWPSVKLPGQDPPPQISFKHDYKFARDWHRRHGPYWTQALERFKDKPNIQYLEVGLFEGASFFWMLEKILTDPTSRATGIDPFLTNYSKIKNYRDVFFENLKMSEAESRSTIIEGFSQTELRKLPERSYDVIYIDGSHTARDVLEDAILCWRLLKPGGVLVFDDYELWWERPVASRPRLGIDVFFAFFGREFTVDHFGYQVMLTRKSSKN